MGSAVAYVVFFEILSSAGSSNASNAMLVTLLIPVTALLLSNLFLDEPILIYELTCAATIGLGCCLLMAGYLAGRCEFYPSA